MAKKIMKAGKVVVILQGRYAGRKAIIVKVIEEGTREREFGHCLVAGIDRSPRKVTKSMSKKKILHRSKIKPFVKYVNFNHIMPTRYQASDIDLKKIVTVESYGAKVEAENKKEVRKEVKKVMEDHYLNRTKSTSGVTFFFEKLRF